MSETIIRRFERVVRRAPESLALVFDGGALTWAELTLKVGGVASALAVKGVGRGARVAVALPNGPAFVAAVLGVLAVGATVAPVDPLMKGEERKAILDDLEPSLVLEDGCDEEAPLETAEAGEAPALILYTSGSTGRPKGALLSHRALAFALESWAGPVMALTPGDVVLAMLPLSHSFGLNGALLAPLVSGATVVVAERFSPEAALDAIGCRRVTIFPGVATMFRRCLDAEPFARTDLSSLRLAVSGAAPCPWSLAEEWRARTGVRLLRGYGMTELFRPISCLANDPREDPEAIGRAVPGVEVRAVDEAGEPLPAGEPGELWIRSPGAMDAYLGAPEESRRVLHDGWFRTGDLVTIAADGFVRVVGRKRERILRGGYSVFPPEVEAVLLAHADVVEAAVIGVPDPDLGEEVAAFVALRPGAASQPDDLIAYCRERLAGYKYPRTIAVLDSLPKSATGKVLKSRLTSR